MSDMTAFERQLAARLELIAGPEPHVDAMASARSAKTIASTRRPIAMFSAVKFIAAGVIVALFGGFLLAGVLSKPEGHVPVPAIDSESPVATGIEILTMVVGGTGALGVDGQGVVWAHEESQPGRLVRFVPGTGATETWSLEEGLAFGMMTTISPSTGPGVWLVGPDRLRLFDGERFVEVVETPETITLAVETPDTALWAATESGSVLRWDGSSWEDLGPGGAEPPTTGDTISALAVDSNGRPWIGRAEGLPGGVSVYDGSDWTTYEGSHAAPLTATVNSIAEHPDGSMWIATDSGLARFDGSAWAEVTPEGSETRHLTSVLATPDGTIWVGSAGWDGDSFSVWRSDGPGWVEYGSDEGLTASEPLDSVPLASVGDRVYVSTLSGGYVFSDGRWEPAWELGIDQFGLCCKLLAVDGDELWVAGEGLWHYERGTWTSGLPDDQRAWTVHDLALSADDTIWAAGSDGISHLEGDRWVVVDETPAVALTVDADGTVWAASEGVGTEGDCQLWNLRVVGESVVRDDIAGCPVVSWWGNSLAVDGDGALWAGAAGGWTPGGLARYDGDRWEVIDEIDGAELYSSAVLGSDPEGAMWVALRSKPGTNDENNAALSLVRFEGTDATIVEPPPGGAGLLGIALGPDGSPWASSDRGPARWDGQQWTFPYEDIVVPEMTVAAVASDGSVFGNTGESLYRLPPTYVITPGSDAAPFPAGEPVDLVYLSDSGGAEVAERYAELAEEALDREVRLHDYRIGGASITRIRDMVRNTLAEVVAEAEIIVLYAHPGGLEYDLPQPNILTCFDALEGDPDYSGPEWTPGLGWEPPVVPTVADWQPYRDVLDQVYDEIWKLREGRPVILRAHDIYNGFIAPWRELGIEPECTANWEVEMQVIREAAEANGAVFVSFFDAFNGPEHDEDPREKGWMGDDGMHANDKGGSVAADALAAVGFEVSEPPR